MELKIEVNDKLVPDEDGQRTIDKKAPDVFKEIVQKLKLQGVVVLATPDIDEDYWLFRVRVTEKQAVVVFPKFGILGCGFQKEIDWNTNLPLDVDAERLWEHIKENKLDADKETTIKAIKLLQEYLNKNNVGKN